MLEKEAGPELLRQVEGRLLSLGFSQTVAACAGCMSRSAPLARRPRGWGHWCVATLNWAS